MLIKGLIGGANVKAAWCGEGDGLVSFIPFVLPGITAFTQESRLPIYRRFYIATSYGRVVTKPTADSIC